MEMVKQYWYHNYCNHRAIPDGRGFISAHRIWHCIL